MLLKMSPKNLWCMHINHTVCLVVFSCSICLVVFSSKRRENWFKALKHRKDQGTLCDAKVVSGKQQSKGFVMNMPRKDRAPFCIGMADTMCYRIARGSRKEENTLQKWCGLGRGWPRFSDVMTWSKTAYHLTFLSFDFSVSRMCKK